MTDPRDAQSVDNAAKVRAYDHERQRLITLHRQAGKAPDEAARLAEETLKDRAPTEAERFDALRADVVLKRLAREASAANPAVERMRVGP